MKVFISQPMDGKTYEQLVDERNVIKDKIREEFGDNIEFIESLVLGGEKTPLKSLANSLSLLSDADQAVFVGNWNRSRGCYIEYMCCGFYGVPILKYYTEG